MQPNRETKSGSVRVAEDSTNFLVSKTIAASQVTIKPGGMREMHWHPNADEWLYILKGTGRATVFNTGPAAVTTNFHAGDIGYVKKALGHYLENTSDGDLVYMEVFRADRFEEVSLSDWLAHSPVEMVAETLNLDPVSSNNSQGTGPTSFPSNVSVGSTLVVEPRLALHSCSRREYPMARLLIYQ
jgi:oxalate decarboxylase